ncbi:MAG: hypothetical protein EOP45_12565 [Sphingobacteriaceae bacterium]|nr:MAG: hypothetical protein EOP45_12565 [Sphingobacteriaceae bacterium]
MNIKNDVDQVIESMEELHFPSRAERESYGSKLRISPFYTQPKEEVSKDKGHLDADININMPTRSHIRPAIDDFISDHDADNHDNHQLVMHNRYNEQQPNTNKILEPAVVIGGEACGIPDKDLTDLKETAGSQWDSASMYAEEQQQAKVCYLIKIEELKEEGVPMYKNVDIDSDLPGIKLCYSFMNERSKRRKLLQRGKGIVNMGANLFGKASDFFQKNDADNDSSEWRDQFKKEIKSGIYDVQIRDVVNKYEHFQPPEEVMLLELIWDSKTRFDDQRNKERRAKKEEEMQGHTMVLDDLENFLGQHPSAK